MHTFNIWFQFAYFNFVCSDAKLTSEHCWYSLTRVRERLIYQKHFHQPQRIKSTEILV